MTNDSDDAVEAETAETGENTSVTMLGEEPVDPEEYARLLAMYEGSFRNISEGEVIKGTILRVSSSEVIVDVGYKSEGDHRPFGVHRREG